MAFSRRAVDERLTGSRGRQGLLRVDLLEEVGERHAEAVGDFGDVLKRYVAPPVLDGDEVRAIHADHHAESILG